MRYLIAFLTILFFHAPALLMVSPLKAAETGPCKQIDFLGQLQRDDPENFKRMMDEARSLKNAGARFYKIEKEGLQPSWILGTLHISDERVTHLPDVVSAAFSQSQTMMMELTEALDPMKMMGALMAKPGMFMFTDGQSLQDLLDPETLAKLKVLGESYGLPFDAMKRMKPWYLELVFALRACEVARLQSGTFDSLDVQLGKRVLAEGKTLLGLEIPDEQFNPMMNRDMDEQIDSLKLSLAVVDRHDELSEAMLQAYLLGYPDLIMQISEYMFPELSKHVDHEAFMYELVVKRNEKMVARALPELEKGAGFIFIGALHLHGEKGMVELIKTHGFRVTPVL